MTYNSLEQRDLYCEVILKDYSFDEYLKPILEQSISKYANSNLTSLSIKKMLDKKMTIYTNVNTLKTNINNFSGYIYEFLCAYEYNAYRNKENVMTTLNPDSSSKTDLLHIINTKNGRIVVPGGDVKSGSPSYVLFQYEKLLKTKYDIPFIDYSGYLTTNKHLLSPKQKKKLEDLLAEYPNKRPVKSIFSPLDLYEIKKDVLAYFETGYLPSEIKKLNIDFKLEGYVKSRETRENLVQLALFHKKTDEPIRWSNIGEYQKVEKNSSSDWISNTEEPEWKKIKDGLEAELKMLNDNREKVGPFKKLKERNSLAEIFKKSINGIAKLAYSWKYSDEISELQHRIKSNDFSLNVEEIYSYLEEKKILEAEEYNHDEDENFYDDEDEYFYDEYEINPSYMDIEQMERSSPVKHNVTGHSRTLKSGKVISVKGHVRGS